MSKPRTFQELAKKAHDIEMTLANRRNKPSSSYEFKKDKGYSKKSSTPSKPSNEGNYDCFHIRACEHFREVEACGEEDFIL